MLCLFASSKAALSTYSKHGKTDYCFLKEKSAEKKKKSNRISVLLQFCDF